MIEVQSLHKRFVQGRGAKARTVQAVDGIDFVAADGCITGLLGPNGAGKTTALRMVAGLIQPDTGRTLVDGIDVAVQPAAALARMGVLSDARGLTLSMLDGKRCARRRTCPRRSRKLMRAASTPGWTRFVPHIPSTQRCRKRLRVLPQPTSNRLR